MGFQTILQNSKTPGFLTFFLENTPLRDSITRWAQDPYAFGSYSNYSVHSSSHIIELLARETADCRVHWAGEHTHTNNGSISGCVHTAFASGQRAAMAIRDQLCYSDS